MGTLLRTVQAHAIPLGILLLANLPGIRQVLANAPLRADTDTVAMLDAMRDTGGMHGWWQWFVGDWFLYNGFYRPITCLSLLIDYTLYGETSWGFRLTNWLLALFTACGFYALSGWFARRCLKHLLTDERQARLFALAGALVLSLQQTNSLSSFRWISAWWLCIAWIWIVGPPHILSTWKTLLRTRWWQLWLGAGALFWGWNRLTHSDFASLIVWVPSRTALLATCLGVYSFWCLLKWGDTGRGRYLLGAGLLYAGACGSYEQSIALVPLALVIAFVMRRQWGWRGWVGAGLVLSIAIAIVLVRLTLLPTTLSGYQQQQIRSSPTIAVVHFLQSLLPALSHLNYWRAAGFDPFQFFFKNAWDTLIADLAVLGTLAAFWRWRRWFGWWLLWQAATYLPMSFLHPFEHYYYLPQLGQDAVDLALIAWGLTHLRAHVTQSPTNHSILGSKGASTV